MKLVRTIPTPHGPLAVFITRKRVKNINLRVDANGQINMSIPMNCPLEEAERMALNHLDWIFNALEKRRGRPAADPLPAPAGREECLALLQAAVVRVYPLVAPYGVAMPQVRIRAMRSQWGNCHWAQGYITLNTALARMPRHLRDYVALHELVHFLHHGHGPDFYARMDALMPRWKEYRKELKLYGSLLNREG